MTKNVGLKKANRKTRERVARLGGRARKSRSIVKNSKSTILLGKSLRNDYIRLQGSQFGSDGIVVAIGENYNYKISKEEVLKLIRKSNFKTRKAIKFTYLTVI